MIDGKNQKTIKIVLYLSIFLAIVGGTVAGILFKGPAIIGIFFGAILGFFAPWVIALLGYTFIALSDPTIIGLKKEDKKK